MEQSQSPESVDKTLKIREVTAQELAAKRGGVWYHAADVPYGGIDYYLIDGQEVPVSKVEHAVAGRLQQEGIITAVEKVPVSRGQKGGVTKEAWFYQKGPNFNAKEGQIGSIITEIWGSFNLPLPAQKQTSEIGKLPELGRKF